MIQAAVEVFEQLEDAERNNLRINEYSPEYKVGIKEGRCRERGHWIQAISNMGEIDEALLGRIIGEVARLYE